MGKNITTVDNNKQYKSASWALLIGIILIGSNLRAPLTSVGSLMSFIRDDLGLSNALAGSITTLPLLAFALLSPFAPKIANRIGMEWTIFLSLILLTVGLVVRSFFGVSLLFVGTVLIGLAIAIGNVLLPGLIKMNYPLRIGLMTGIYAVFMNLFGALASGLSVPISSISGIGWKGSLAFWGILSIVALLVWIPQLRKSVDSPKAAERQEKEKHNIWKSPLAWYITVFMGMQSLVFYTLITWLPEILLAHGYGSSAAGWMLSLMQFSLIPITFIVPLIAEKMSNQKLLAGITGALFFIGIVGLIAGNAVFIPVSIILLGIGAGSAFSLSMMFFSLRTTSGQQASEMSGMAQSFGYLMAATGPVLFGALHDISNSWIIPLIVLGVVAGIIFVCGLQAGKNRTITDIGMQKKRQSENVS